MPAASVKPLLRGVLHQIACGLALAGTLALSLWAPTRRGQLAAAIYGLSLTALFGVSALYHRGHWSPAVRPWLRRLDHSAIGVLIAGTYTPFCMVLPPAQERLLLAVVWVGAASGVVLSLAWVHAPKVVTAIVYLALGWSGAPFFPAMRRALDAGQLVLLAAGGLAYSAGAVVYALRRPDPAPTVFGYHEIFHALTIVASVCHFIAIVTLIAHLG